MRVQVIFASFLMLTISLAGCITDSTVEQITDDITEVLGCMDEEATNYNPEATEDDDSCESDEEGSGIGILPLAIVAVVLIGAVTFTK